MTNEKRVNEIVSQITAFSKDTYNKSEFLPELLKLQKELIDLTFNAENGDLRLWDVERHLRKMNDERGHVADNEPEIIQEETKEPENNIETKPDNKNTIVRKYGGIVAAAVGVTLINVVFIGISRLIRK